MKINRVQNYFLIINLLFLIIFINCSTLSFKGDETKKLDFDYKTISKTYFRPENTKPFPLTVRRGNNLNGSVSADGRYLYFSGDILSNLNIYVRDLKSSIVVPLTLHPSADYKPSISPDGKKLAFVSERYDSQGDIFIADIQVEEIIKAYTKGESISDSYPLFPLTNREYLSKGIIKRCVDTDPTWSPDGRYIAYVSDCDSSGKTNIYISDSKNSYSTTILTNNGAASPSYSPDGKFIYYISYKDSPLGEIYKIELATKIETRITNNSFLELNPSLSGDGNYLYYTSIRNDTNKNGKLGARDNGFIIRKNLASGEESELTGGNFPLFDTKFTNFIDGSIIFSASFDNSINIFFIPSSGEIPKRSTISQQYELADRYRDRSSDFSQFAFSTIGTYFSNDPLYPLFKSRSDRQVVRDFESEGRDREANSILKTMLAQKEDPKFAYSYALAIEHTYKRKKQNSIPILETFFEEVKQDPKYLPEIAPSILQLTAETYEERGDIIRAREIYETILKEYPTFYRTNEMKVALGTIAIRENPNTIPEYYIEIYGISLNRKNSLTVVREISRAIDSLPTYQLQNENLLTNISNVDLKTKNNELHSYLNYLYAKNIRKEDKFEESNKEIEKYLSTLSNDSYVYLSSLMLQYENYRDLGKYNIAQNSLLKLIENYEYKSGIEVDTDIIENTLQSAESLAKNSELRENFKLALENYEKINLFLSASIEKKLPLQGVYDQYATYYHRKMIETSLNLSQGKRDSKLESLLSDANILTGSKINLLGATTKTLSSLLNFKVIKYFIDFKDFNYISTYNSDAFEIPENFYVKRKESALKSMDLGAIYGYSYLLISRAVLRESIYLEKQSLTDSRKKSILEELKEAELNLQWVIYANPNYNEAYLLLGWLYQYIDIRKRSFLEGEDKREEEIFESLYTKFFPLKYLEENVELYKQIIEFKGKTNNHKLFSDLHLNLGNTYFLLNDFENAVKEYSIVEKSSKHIIPSVQFENYKQKTIYLYNFARANIYAGKIENAIPYLEEATSIYYKEEYYPTVAKIGINKENDKLNSELLETRKKLTLLNSLLGLAEMELDNYHQAIFRFTTAVSMNGETKYINDIGLYNSLALCYQKIGDYNKSEDALKKSDLEFRSKQSRLRKILNYSIWDTLFPENLRVIGEGRFPGEMPDEFSNLLGQGIRIQNSIDNKEFTNTSELIQKRYDFLKENSLEKNTSGQKIMEKSILSLAYNEYQKGNFLKSSDLYTKDYKDKASSSMVDAFNSYLRSDIALFSHIEENSEPKDKLLEELNNNIKFLNLFKIERSKECNKKYPDIEKETNFCEIDFYKKYPDHEISLANNYFYLGEIYFSQKKYEESAYFYGLSIQKSTSPGNIPTAEIGLNSDPYTMKQRCRLKITAAISFLRIKENNKFLEFLKDASYIADEFQLLKETLTIQYLLAEYYYTTGKNKNDFQSSIEYIKKIESLIKNNQGLFYTLDNTFFINLYTLRNFNYVKLRNIEELRISNEKLFSAILYNEVLTNEYKFQDENLFSKLNELQLAIREDNELNIKIENTLQAKRDSKSLLQEKTNNLEIIKNRYTKLLSLIPKSMDIRSWMDRVNLKQINIEKDTCLLEVYSNRDDILLYVTTRNGSKLVISSFKNFNQDLESLLLEFPDIKKIVYNPSVDTFQFNLSQIKFKDKTLSDFYEVRHIFKISQFIRETGFDFSRLKRVSSITNPKNKSFSIKDSDSIVKKINLRSFGSNELKNYLSDTDILVGSLDFYNKKMFLGEKREGFINAKEVVENQWNIPLVIINNYEKSETNFYKVGFLYDILNFSGVQSILLLEDSSIVNSTKEKILSDMPNSNSTIQKEKLILLGEKITPYPEDQKVYEDEFLKFTNLGRKEERNRNYLESIRYFLQANSVLPDNRPDLQIESEINLNRLKKKLYPDFDFLKNYKEILKVFSNIQVNKENFLFNTLVTCYEDLGNKNCNYFYKEYKNLDSPNETNSFIIDYYSSIYEGNIKFIIENKIKFNSVRNFKDLYLNSLNLANLYSNLTLWTFALEEINLSLEKSNSKYETEFANSIKSDIYYEYFFINGIDINLDNKEKITFYAKNRFWDKYNEKLNSMFLKEPDSFKREYLKRIYKSYELMENSPDFQPISLSPIFLKTGEPSLSLLKETDRVFLFYLLVNSLPFQKGDELNNQFDLLLQTEKTLKNTNKSLWLEVQWALALYSRGDLRSSKNYFLKFAEDYQENYREPSLNNMFLLLKYKLSKTDEEIEFTIDEKTYLKNSFKEWYSFYENVESINSVDQFYSILTSLISSKKNQKLDLYNKRELLDFLTFLMIEAENKKYWDVVLNLTYYREIINSINDKIYESPKFSDIPLLNKSISKILLQKIPDKQCFIALSDIGIKTYKILIEKNKISGEEIFSDNRIQKDLILNYLNSIKEYGESVLQQKYLEEIYREKLILEKNKTTYLYFPSYHFKVYLHPNEYDKFYYVLSLEEISKRELSTTHRNFNPPYSFEITYKPSTGKEKILFDLIEMEKKLLPNGKKGKEVQLSNETLNLKNNKSMEFNDEPLRSIKGNKVKKSAWIYSGSRLGQSSLKSDDFTHSMLFIDKLKEGVGVVSVGLQADTHTSYFIKELLKINGPDSFFERYTDAINSIKKRFNEDRYWIGLRPYSNVFLKND